MTQATRLFFETLFVLLLSAGVCSTPAIVEADDAVVVDGISAIVGNRSSNESDAQPVLLSDITFDAILITSLRLGPGAGYEDPAEKDWEKARRQAVLVRLLAAQARLLHETVTSDDKQAIRDEISTLAGGDMTLYRVLARHGIDPQLIDIFIENVALALTQIQYFEEQTDLIQRSRRANERHKEKRGSRLRGAFRALVAKQHANEQIKRWIKELIAGGHIRIIR